MRRAELRTISVILSQSFAVIKTGGACVESTGTDDGHDLEIAISA